MMELPLVLLSGLLGSGHCVGMCGAFAMAIGWKTQRPLENGLRQICYGAGRAVTYSFLGAVAGFAGQRMQSSLNWLESTQGVLSVIAGVLLLGAGMISAGWLPAIRWRRSSTSGGVVCSAAAQFRALLSAPSRWSVFVAGLATGFLPCGLVYALLMMAASSTSVVRGAVIMAVFALGTMPLMIATGMGSSLLSLPARTRLMKLAAASVVLMGCLTVTRGAGFLMKSPGADHASGCPLCAPQSRLN